MQLTSQIGKDRDKLYTFFHTANFHTVKCLFESMELAKLIIRVRSSVCKVTADVDPLFGPMSRWAAWCIHCIFQGSKLIRIILSCLTHHDAHNRSQ